MSRNKKQLNAHFTCCTNIKGEQQNLGLHVSELRWLVNLKNVVLILNVGLQNSGQFRDQNGSNEQEEKSSKYTIY